MVGVREWFMACEKLLVTLLPRAKSVIILQQDRLYNSAPKGGENVGSNAVQQLQ